MGFKQAAVLAPISFFLGKISKRRRLSPVKSSNLLGVFFICFNVDHRILWGEMTEDVVTDGFQFYTTFFNAPPAIKVYFITTEMTNVQSRHTVGSITWHGGRRHYWSCFQTSQMG